MTTDDSRSPKITDIIAPKITKHAAARVGAVKPSSTSIKVTDADAQDAPVQRPVSKIGVKLMPITMTQDIRLPSAPKTEVKKQATIAVDDTTLVTATKPNGDEDVVVADAQPSADNPTAVVQPVTQITPSEPSIQAEPIVQEAIASEDNYAPEPMQLNTKDAAVESVAEDLPTSGPTVPLAEASVVAETDAATTPDEGPELRTESAEPLPAPPPPEKSPLTPNISERLTTKLTDTMQSPAIYDTKEYIVPIKDTMHNHGTVAVVVAGCLSAVLVVGAVVAAAVYIV